MVRQEACELLLDMFGALRADYMLEKMNRCVCNCVCVCVAVGTQVGKVVSIGFLCG